MQILPESEELTIGAQAFPNLDNDDADPMFDHEDTDGVPDGDNELVQLLLQLPREARGEAVLRHVKGPAEAFKLWTTDEKKTRFKPGQVSDVPRDFRDTGANLEKLVWVEPLSPTAVGESLQFEFKPRLTATRKLYWAAAQDASKDPATGPGSRIMDVLPHEVGHLFGATHGDGELIDRKGEHFSEKTLAKIRKALHP